MTSVRDDGVSASQEMQNQVEALYLDEDKQIIEKMMQEKKGDPERGTEFLSTFDSQAEAGADQGLTRAVTRDGVGFYTSDKWAEFYLTSEVAVVTNIGHPPVPPGGEERVARDKV
uniref:Uncharacterized protein n=1 Tax=Hyaloperonospora arabidopsidis (strain Emoy2) TaxID=559515 RepID=M4BBV7_HYAAE